MCFGFPLVIGQEGADGSLVHTLRALLDAGLQPDPGRPPRKRSHTHKDTYLSYPILLHGPSQVTWR